MYAHTQSIHVFFSPMCVDVCENERDNDRRIMIFCGIIIIENLVSVEQPKPNVGCQPCVHTRVLECLVLKIEQIYIFRDCCVVFDVRTLSIVLCVYAVVQIEFDTLYT